MTIERIRHTLISLRLELRLQIERLRVDGYRIELRSLESLELLEIEKEKTIVLVLTLVISLNYSNADAEVFDVHM